MLTSYQPVILNQVENELQETVHSPNNTLALYMERLESAYRAAGITVPFTHNEKGQRCQSWSTDYGNVGGAVNMYGLDSYPGGFSCTNVNSGFNVVRNYYQWFANYSFAQPNYFTKFEGGYFTPWVAASMMIALQSMIQVTQTSIIKTILGKERHYRIYIWHGEGLIGCEYLCCQLRN
jgi:hypothetical protein